jgi:hypothetical protein
MGWSMLGVCTLKTLAAEVKDLEKAHPEWAVRPVNSSTPAPHKVSSAVPVMEVKVECSPQSRPPQDTAANRPSLPPNHARRTPRPSLPPNHARRTPRQPHCAPRLRADRRSDFRSRRRRLLRLRRCQRGQRHRSRRWHSGDAATRARCPTVAPPFRRALQSLPPRRLPRAPLLLRRLSWRPRHREGHLPLGVQRPSLRPLRHLWHGALHLGGLSAEMRRQPPPLCAFPSGTLARLGHRFAPDAGGRLFLEHGHSKMRKTHGAHCVAAHNFPLKYRQIENNA